MLYIVNKLGNRERFTRRANYSVLSVRDFAKLLKHIRYPCLIELLQLFDTLFCVH